MGFDFPPNSVYIYIIKYVYSVYFEKTNMIYIYIYLSTFIYTYDGQNQEISPTWIFLK